MIFVLFSNSMKLRIISLLTIASMVYFMSTICSSGERFEQKISEILSEHVGNKKFVSETSF